MKIACTTNLERLLLLILIGIYEHSICAQQIFINGGRNIYSFDPQTCQYTLVVTTPHGFLDIAFDRQGRLYGSSSDLERINISNGNLTKLVDLNTVLNGMTISADDFVYMGTPDGELISYDLNSGTTRYHGNMGFGCSGDFTFYKGELFMAAFNNQLVRINIEHPEKSELVLTHQSQSAILGIVSEFINCEETNVYALSGANSEVFRIDFDNLQLNFICQLPINVNGGASTSEFLTSIKTNLGEPQIVSSGCHIEFGSVSFPEASGFGELFFSLNGSSWQSEFFFDSLLAGIYVVALLDEHGCTDTAEVMVSQNPEIQLYDLIITPTPCQQSNGQISFAATGGTGELQFSLDEGPPQSSLYFTKLSPGNHTLLAIDEIGCMILVSFEVPVEAFDADLTLVTEDAVCGASTGSIKIHSTDMGVYTYSIDGELFQPEPVFDHLEEGQHVLIVQNIFGCFDTIPVLIGSHPSPELSIYEIMPEICMLHNGRIEVEVSQSEPPFLFQLSGGIPQSSNIFDSLTSGLYTIKVSDHNGCIDSISVNVPFIEGLKLERLELVPPDCYFANGVVRVFWSGNYGVPVFQVYDQSGLMVQNETALMEGKYRLVLSDDSGCSVDSTIILKAENCHYFIPNVFSPNGDGVNDLFEVYVPMRPDQQIACSIYDRWGNEVFSYTARAAEPVLLQWDGTWHGKECASGVYVVCLQLNDDSANISGKEYSSITLLR